MNPGVYIHLPFCKVHCAYCDFPLTTRQSLAADYYQCLMQEIAIRPAPEADTLYFGGGTPSLTPTGVLCRIRDHFPLAADREITLEANPDDVTAQKAAEWKELGVTRLSLGIQSLDARVLRAALRQHTPEQAADALRIAQESGFESVNVDLILGLPEQTPSAFLNCLSALITSRPHHFSIYFVEVHPGTALQRQVSADRRAVMPEEEQLSCYDGAIKRLESAGYIHYEVSNFALPGHESRHNLKYWSAAPYYAYGPGACSFYDSRRIRNVASVPEYIQRVRSGRSPAEDITVEDEDTRMRNALIFGLRRRDGVDRSAFQMTYGADPLALFEDADALLTNGFLEIRDGRLRLTLQGLLISNSILSEVV